MQWQWAISIAQGAPWEATLPADLDRAGFTGLLHGIG